MVVDPSAVIRLGEQVGAVISKVLDKLPTHDQKVLKSFAEFEMKYQEEIKRADNDYDDLVIYRARRSILLNTVVKKITEISKG